VRLRHLFAVDDHNLLSMLRCLRAVARRVASAQRVRDNMMSAAQLLVDLSDINYFTHTAQARFIEICACDDEASLEALLSSPNSKTQVAGDHTSSEKSGKRCPPVTSAMELLLACKTACDQDCAITKEQLVFQRSKPKQVLRQGGTFVRKTCVSSLDRPSANERKRGLDEADEDPDAHENPYKKRYHKVESARHMGEGFAAGLAVGVRASRGNTLLRGRGDGAGASTGGRVCARSTGTSIRQSWRKQLAKPTPWRQVAGQGVDKCSSETTPMLRAIVDSHMHTPTATHMSQRSVEAATRSDAECAGADGSDVIEERGVDREGEDRDGSAKQPASLPAHEYALADRMREGNSAEVAQTGERDAGRHGKRAETGGDASSTTSATTSKHRPILVAKKTVLPCSLVASCRRYPQPCFCRLLALLIFTRGHGQRSPCAYTCAHTHIRMCIYHIPMAASTVHGRLACEI